MSRPRTPFGSDHPGRVPSTMMKVLAAESGDPQRLRRAKAYASTGAVLDIDIRRGLVTVEVQGSRPTPYVAEIGVQLGDGMPLRRDLWFRCSCPDDAGTSPCKHVLAGMFAMSNEFLLEPELLDVWRGREPGDDASPTGPVPRPAAAITRRHLTLVASDEGDTSRSPDVPVGFFEIPPGETLPAAVLLDDMSGPRPRRADLAEVLSEALANLRVDWG